LECRTETEITGESEKMDIEDRSKRPRSVETSQPKEDKGVPSNEESSLGNLDQHQPKQENMEQELSGILEIYKKSSTNRTTTQNIIENLPISSKFAGPELTELANKLKHEVTKSANGTQQETNFCLSCHNHVGLKNFIFLLEKTSPNL